MDRKYLQRRSHRFTQGRIPRNLIYIKNVSAKRQYDASRNKLIFLGSTTCNSNKKILLFVYRQGKVCVLRNSIIMTADCNNFILHIPCELWYSNLKLFNHLHSLRHLSDKHTCFSAYNWIIIRVYFCYLSLLVFGFVNTIG
jgi:hypothetical protein